MSKATKSRGKKKVQEAAPVVEDTSALTTYLARLQVLATTIHEQAIATIPFNRHIFGIPRVSELVDKNVVLEVVRGTWIGASAICLWIRHLYDDVMIVGEHVAFEFITPHVTSQIKGLKHEDRLNGIKQCFALKATNRTLFLVPVNIGVHWILLVINASEEQDPIIYYPDPVETSEPDNHRDLMYLFNNALTGYRASVGKRYSKTTNQKDAYKWKKIQCPYQPNGNDCGYYVMQFMRDVVTHDQIEIPSNYYADARCAVRSNEKMGQLIEEWSRYVYPLFSQDLLSCNELSFDSDENIMLMTLLNSKCQTNYSVKEAKNKMKDFRKKYDKMNECNKARQRLRQELTVKGFQLLKNNFAKIMARS